MQHGPALNQVYDLIKGEASRVASGVAISIPSTVPSNCGKILTGRAISRRGRELTEVTDRYRNVDDWGFLEATHESEEWCKNYSEGTVA